MRSSIRLLLVEGNDIQVALFRELLKRVGGLSVNVTDVATLLEGQQQLDDHDFDLIITDFTLPDSSGIQILDGLMAHAHGLPVVALSGGTNVVETLEAFARSEIDAAQPIPFGLVPDDSPTDVVRASEFFYQPIVDIADDTVWGYEALARWPASGRPDSTEQNLRRLFNSAAAPDFAAHTINSTCNALVNELKADGVSPLISFNLHSTQFANPMVISSGLEAILASTAVSAARLQIELTDAAKLLPNTAAVEMLWRLHAMGVRIAIDDICDDNSSFATLLTLPVDTVKIDRTVTSKLADSQMASRIVGGLVHLCRASTDLVAEGVETDAERNLLLALGVHLQQGYLHGRPAAIAPSITKPRDGEFEDLLSTRQYT